MEELEKNNRENQWDWENKIWEKETTQFHIRHARFGALLTKKSNTA